MTRKDEEKRGFDIEKFVKLAKRENAIREWLSGVGERTEEEEKLAEKFTGSEAELLAKKAIALARRTQVLETVSNDSPKTESERELVNNLLQPDSRLLRRTLLRIARINSIKQFLRAENDNFFTDEGVDDSEASSEN